MTEAQTTLEKLHVGRLIFGVVFITIGMFGLIDAEFSTTWIWVGVLAAAGVTGLATAVRSLFSE